MVDRTIYNTVLNVIKRDFSEFLIYFTKTWEGHRLYYANISIMRSDIFDEYCRFVFTVFDNVENDLVKEGLFIEPLKEKSLYRRFGYIGELLTNAFVIKKINEGEKVKDFSMLYCS